MVSITYHNHFFQSIHNQYPDFPVFVFDYSFGGPASLNCVKEVNFIEKLFLRTPVPLVGKATMQNLEAWEGNTVLP